MDSVGAAVTRLKRHTELPVAVGFGIRTPAQAAEIARIADATVVGSALVDKLAANLDDKARAKPSLVDAVLADVMALADGVRGARKGRA
jgi:tryptophan synthase alpha chain